MANNQINMSAKCEGPIQENGNARRVFPARPHVRDRIGHRVLFDPIPSLPERLFQYPFTGQYNQGGKNSALRFHGITRPAHRTLSSNMRAAE